MVAIPAVIAARSAKPLVIAALWAIANRLLVQAFPIIAWVAAAMLSDTVNSTYQPRVNAD
jgi:hypothetical protein